MKNKRNGVYVLAAVFTALVALLTMVFHIPVPATKGFINLGDTLIFTTALLLGKKIGFLAGGVGSALADLLLGYPQWAPFTLIIKGLEGFIAGLLGHQAFLQKSDMKRPTLALVVAGLWMITGYFFVGGFMYSFPAALVELPGNFFQAGVSTVIALPLSIAIRKSGIIKGI